MDHLSGKAINAIEERDVPGQLLLALGMTPIETAMTAGLDAVDMALIEPAIETPKKTTKSYARPAVWDVDEHGDMRSVGASLGGYVELEEYDRLLVAYEELLSRLESIKELTEL